MTILALEDDPEVRGLIAHALRSCGYRVLEAVVGEEALARWPAANGFDLLPTDVVMGARRAPEHASPPSRPAGAPHLRLRRGRVVSSRRTGSASSCTSRNAIKILMNSFYGVLGTATCRFFDPRLANAIAGFGREPLPWCQARIAAEGHGDTASLLVETGAVDAGAARAFGETSARRTQARAACIQRKGADRSPVVGSPLRFQPEDSAEKPPFFFTFPLTSFRSPSASRR